jgi:cell division protein ZapA
MEDRKPATNRVIVTVYGEQYVVRGKEDSAYIEMLASYVDRKMNNIASKSPNLSVTRVAVLTALNLADELSKLQEDYDKLIATLEERKKEGR